MDTLTFLSSWVFPARAGPAFADFGGNDLHKATCSGALTSLDGLADEGPFVRRDGLRDKGLIALRPLVSTRPEGLIAGIGIKPWRLQ